MPVTNRFPLWGRQGETPDDGFEYEGGDQVNEKHLNYLWDASQKQAADFIEKTNDLQENKLQRDGSQAMTGELSVQGVSTQGTRTFFRNTETRMTFHLDRTRLRSQNVTIEQDLAKEGGPTIWDSQAEVVRNLETHAGDHSAGGADELNVTGLSGDLADRQDPKNHADRHEQGGPDEIDATGLQVGGSTTDAHADRHERGGADAIEIIDLDASTGQERQVAMVQADGTLAYEVAGLTEEEMALILTGV